MDVQHLPRTDILDPYLEPPTRRGGVRVCWLYSRPEPSGLIHARALLSLLQECGFAGDFVSCSDLNAFYQTRVCPLHGWHPRHWTALARWLGKLAKKRMLRRHGKKFVAYQIPKPNTRSDVQTNEVHPRSSGCGDGMGNGMGQPFPLLA